MSNCRQEVTKLSGKWNFYEKILSPREIDSTAATLVKVPSYWHVGNRYKGYGYGLYHIRIKGASKELLGLRLDRIHSSYSVWINKELVHKSGSPSANKMEAIPRIDNKPIYFTPPDDAFDLFIGVSNYNHGKGGIIKAVLIGQARRVQDAWVSGLIRETILVILIFAIALFTLLLFFSSHRQIAYLYFAIFCFFSILRLVSTEHHVLAVFLPSTPYSLILIFRYVGFFMSGTFIALYCEKLIPTMDGHWVIKFFAGSGLICSLGILLAPSWTGHYISKLFQLSTFISFPVFYFLLVKAISMGRRDLILVGLSVTSIIIAFVHDVLVVAELAPWELWQIYGFVFAAIFQLLYFAFEYKSLNQKVDSLHSSFTSLGIIHKEKSEFEHTLISEIKKELNQGRSDDGFLRDVLKKINRGPFIPGNQKVTIETVDKVNQEFLIKLKKKYPDLTQKETELSLSLKARLSTREIASTRNITVESVKKARSRLRQKLGLAKETDLYQFFESF
ncbi:MAG: hypothetical protein JXR03_04715 [Cyclobacteriaceae bacterium]